MKTLALLLIAACDVPAFGAVPSAVSVTPSSGSGVSQVFSFVFTSPNGTNDIYNMYMDIGTYGVGEPHSCLVRYGNISPVVRLVLTLMADNGYQDAGTVQMGTTQSASNSQCTISGSGGMAVFSGDNITVPVAITFLTGFNGKKNIFAFAENNQGGNSGSQLLGTWTPSEPTLTAASVAPNTGGGAIQTFTGSYSDSAGASDVQVAYLILTTAATQPAANSCLVAYVPSSNQLYLFNDAANGVVSGSPITAGTASTLTNSQCILSGSGGTATLTGNNVNAPFNLTFESPLLGIQQNIYGMVQRYDGAQSTWALLGTWTP